MTHMYRFGCFLAAMLLSAAVHANDIQVESAWARATAPGQETGMADLTITSKQAAALLVASSPVCKTVEIHSMTHENGMMKMREVKMIELPAGKSVNLGESGYHLMLIGLKAPLKAGEAVPLTLTFRVGSRMAKVETSAGVRPLAEAKPAPKEMSGHKHSH